MKSALNRPLSALSWIAQLAAAAILLQTLYFKFSGAPESRWIFSTLGVEPWGRIASGVLELVAGALLLHPRGAASGAVLSMGLMTGALLAHLTRLGIAVQDDGGLLFGLALAVFACAAFVATVRRRELPVVGCKFA